MKNYSIGLDIGTNSVGWAVMSDDLKLIRKRMKINGNTKKKHIKKNFWGVRLFDAGETAEARRLKRTTRRRYTRRRQRIKYLQDMFQLEMDQVDPNFFHRLNDSFYVEDDKTYSKYPIFGSVEEEVKYHKDYPTIYHLRKSLADSKEKEDLRLIYLALAHIIKFRGHFLIEGELNSENTSISREFSEFLDIYNETFSKGIEYLEADEEIVEEFLHDNVSRTRKFERVLQLFSGEKSNGLFAQYLKLIVGNLGNFKKPFNLEEDAKLQFSKETFEEDLEQLIGVVDESYLDVFLAAKNVYDSIELAGIISDSHIPTRAKLSNKMIEFYEEHENDLATLKKFIREKAPSLYYDLFNDSNKNGYAGYIDGSTTQGDFYKYVKSKLNKVDGSAYFIDKIDRELFLRKQRSFYNGVIPHQIHLHELRAIIQKQSHFYPFLSELEEKIVELFKFKIPYYVGPLARGNSEFAWLTRKNNEKITPWNFDEVIDRDTSAINFIERMTNYDTYLPTEKVLPKRSLLYQKYMIFNELTKVTYTDDRGTTHNFSGHEKLDIFNSLFKANNRVTSKKLIEFLRNSYHIESAQLKGIEDSFNASYSTYRDLRKIEGMSKLLDTPDNDDMFEDIVKILTVFEDRKMRKTQLNKYNDVLSDKQINQLSRKHYTGWGRLSAKLINGIRDIETNKTILDYLIEDDGPKRNINRNFMQLINDELLSFKPKISEAQAVDQNEQLADVVSELPGSPAIKKGILQSLKIVNEIVEIMGYQPDSIVVEMARENQTTSQGRNQSIPRYTRLEKAIKELGSKILSEEPTNNQEIQKERLYLYYLQNGKDMYTNRDLDLHNLSNYDIDHIIPQSITTDNSINNKVLVSSAGNRGHKADDVPSEDVVKKMKTFWESLHKAGLMSERKFQNLTKAERGGLSENEMARFLNRQLVETRQITKHVANILDSHFNTEQDDQGKTIRDVKIITLKSSLTSQLRKEFGIHKVRSINDYHHAHDAYLNTVVANKLLKVYPQLAPEFVYGDYPHYDSFKENRATARKQKMTNIMKFFASEDIRVSEEGEVVWDVQRDIRTIKNTLSSKQINIVKKTEVQSGGFSKESIQPRGDSDKLIARKNNWDPVKYGGFNSPVIAYSVAITHEKGKKAKVTKALVGISIMEQKRFERDSISFLEEKGYINPNVLMKLPKYTLYEFENGRRRMIASASEAQKANQMVLSNHLVELLYHAERYDEINFPKSFKYVNENVEKFAEVLKEVEMFAKKNTLADKNLEIICKIYEENTKNDTAELASSFIELLTFNEPGAPSDFNFLGKKIPRKRYTSLSELWDATIVHQSITGLHETRVRFEVE